MSIRTTLAICTVFALAACTDNATSTSPMLSADRSPELSRNDGGNPTGDVYVMTNAAESNVVLAFHRAANGSLQGPKTFATGGRGSGRPRLGSQGSILLSGDGSRLYVVNVGSSDISVFDVTSSGLRLIDREPSGGAQPFSITLRGTVLYVLNHGDEMARAAANITGFRVAADGALSPLAGSARPLGTAYPDPAQVSFTPDGHALVVTEKGTDKIDTYALGSDGRALDATPMVHPSSGVTPFGFDFTRAGTFVVTEAFGGVIGQAAASAYSLAGGSLTTLSASIKDTQSEVCWTAITHDDRYAYVTNFGTGTISSYSVHSDGRISLLQAVAGQTAVGFGPRDEDFSADGRYLYVIDIGLTSAATRGVHAFHVEEDGSLKKIDFALVSGYPALAGLASR
jgi:6-phosphogluconolactonase